MNTLISPCTDSGAVTPSDASLPPLHSGGALALGGALGLLAGCGGGGGGGDAVATGGGPSTATPETVPPSVHPAAPPPVTAATASRFLAQAALGANRDQINQVMNTGYAAWIDSQLALPQGMSRCDWLVSKGYGATGPNNAYRNSLAGFDACAWRKLLSSPDVLRQRVTLALSEILVVSAPGLLGPWKQFAAAHYLDLLENNAFGNYRTLLYQVSTSPAMGEYLTFRGNARFNPASGALPDENYARELMQLFTIGLVQLNLDGTPQLQGGQAQETYGLDDITGLARIFTGWDWDTRGTGQATPDFQRRPMVQVTSRHETGASSFLRATVPAGLDGDAGLNAALDILFAHPNVAPFVSRQLIQRLVSSNPSPAYVQRVAQVFLNDGHGTAGNLAAVVRALLLDDEARSAPVAAGASAGKLREPVLRFIGWARAFGANSATDTWAVGDTSDPANRLGQSPLRSPTVFNFFRPGYVPPNSAIGSAGLVAPEFQLTNETSVVGYLNFMQTVVSNGIGDVVADYTALLPLADDAQALLAELNTVLAAGQIGADNLALIRTAIDTMPAGTATARYSRVHAALVLVLATPEYLVQK